MSGGRGSQASSPGPRRITPGSLVQGVLVLALAAVLAGCVGADAPEAPPSSPTPAGVTESPTADGTSTPDRFSWSLRECRAVVALVPTDAASIEGHLPEGFTPADAQEAFGIPPDARGDAALGVETFQCGSGTTLDGTAEPLAYGSVFAPVEAPDDRNTTGADAVFYKWETLVPDDDRRQLLQDEGLPAVDGSTDVSGLHSHPAGHTFRASLTLAGHTHAFSGTVHAPAQDFRDGLPFVEFQAGDGGMARWGSTTNEAPDAFQGTGTFDPAPGSRAAEIVGDPPSQVYMVAATTVTFSEGYLDLPGTS